MSDLESEDEDIKRAIALSLAPIEYNNNHKSQGSTIDLTLDDDLDQTLPVPKPESKDGINSGFSLGKLDRKAMEAERLARQNTKLPKRERSISPPATSRPTKVSKTIVSETVTPQSTRPKSNVVNPIKTDGSMQFPLGKLFKTWSLGHERTNNEIKIEEVLERRTLSSAVLSSFQIDFAWLFTKFETQKTKFMFVLHAKQAEQREHLVSELGSLGSNVGTCIPPLDGGSICMHSKLMLLFHPDKLRVVIPSANLVPYDWGESGIMENTVWIIDLPRVVDDESGDLQTLFLTNLRYFLKRQGLSESIMNSLNKFNWSKTRSYAFIHSIAGSTYGKDATTTGLAGLSTAVNELGLCTRSSQIDMCASSIGAIKTNFLNSIVAAARGEVKLTVPPSNVILSLPDIPKSNLDACFRLYYPTRNYISSSPGGYGNGGTIWLKRQHYTRDDFPKHVFHRYQSVRSGMLSHCKMIFIRGVSTSKRPSIFPSSSSSSSDTSKQGAPIAFLYAGSANCSESAWGNISLDKTSAKKGQVRVICRNWECGVLIPVVAPTLSTSPTPSLGQKLSTKDDDDDDDDDLDNVHTEPLSKKVQVPQFDIFTNVLDGPFQYPAEKMGSEEPWYCEEHLYKNSNDNRR